MMRVTRGAVLLAAAVACMFLTGAASAGYDVGSSLTADAPVKITGRGEGEILAGIAGLVGASGGSTTSASLTAQEAWLAHTEQRTTTCTQPQVPPVTSCTPTSAPATETAHLRDVTLRVSGGSGAFKLVATNDGAYLADASPDRGAIVAAIGGQSTLAATGEALFLTPYAADWTTSRPQQGAGPVYQVARLTPSLATGGNQNLHATGDFELLLQGLKITIEGTDADSGERVTRTYDTTSAASGTSFLVVEAREGSLTASSPAPLTAYALNAVKLPAPSYAQLTGATGRLVRDGATAQHDGESLRLDGPLALTNLKAQDGAPLRITFSVGSDGAPTDVPNDVQSIAAAAAAGAGGAGLLAAAAYFWPRLKYATTLLMLPLYSRIERTQVLEHEKRDEIYNLIAAAPGIHAHEIGERAKIGWGTTVYHLKMLENHALVVSKKSGRYKRFYVNTGEYTKKKDVYAALRNETAKAVAEFIVNNPGTSQKDMCAALGIQPSLASWHVEKLEGVGLVKRVKDGRQVRYFAGPAWSELNVRLTPGGGAETVAET